MLPTNAMAAYHERHYQHVSGGFTPAFQRRAANGDPVSTHSFGKQEIASDYFREVMQPLDAYHVLYAVLKDGNRPFAQLSFYRGRADRAFDASNAETLRSLLRYISIGLSCDVSAGTDADSSVVVEEALGIVKPDGRVASAPDGWSRMLRLASLSEVSPRNATKESQHTEAFLRRLCDTLTPAAGKLSTNEFVHQTPWGRFAIRAFRLSDHDGRRADQVGILIKRSELHAVSLVRGTGGVRLSPQQREVALLLAQGKSNREIAETLSLSINTTNYHVKQVFAKLDVNERTAVSGKLLKLAQVAASL